MLQMDFEIFLQTSVLKRFLVLNSFLLLLLRVLFLNKENHLS